VEANPAIIPVLRVNRDINRCAFRIVNAALAYGSDVVSFGVSSSIGESSLVATEQHSTVSVPATQLERVLDDAGFSTCAVVCDIEGAEDALVANEAAVFARRVDTVLIEVHPQILSHPATEDLLRRFRHIGFTLAWSRGDVWVLTKKRTDAATPHAGAGVTD
jgi:FkbM family methyltransferase